MAGNTIQDLLVQLGMDASGFEAGVSTAEKALEHLGTSFAEIAEGFSLSAVAAEIIEIGHTFEQASIQIQRSTGLAGESVHGLEESFANVYAASEQSSTSIAAALSQISIHTGAAGVELESLTQSALAFAKVTGSDVQTSVTQNERLFAEWGVATADQAEALDMLYVASTKSGVGTQQLASEMSAMGPVLQSFGFSFESSLALIATFEKAGLDATTTVRTLSVAFKAWAEAGEDPSQKLSELIEKIKGAGTAAEGMQIAIADGLTGRALLPFVNAAQKGAFETGELQAMLDHAKDSVKAMADGTDTLADHWTKLWHGLSDGIGGPAKQFLEWTGDALGKVTELANKIELFPNLINNMFGGLKITQLAHLLSQPNGAVAGIDAPIGGTGLINPLPGNGLNSLNTPLNPGGAGGAMETTGGGAVKGMSFEDNPLLHPDEWKRLQKATAEAYATIVSIDEGIDEKWNEAASGIAKGADEMLHPLAQAKDALSLIGKAVEETAAQSMAASPFGQLADAAKYFGITSSQQYGDMALVAKEKFEEMKNSGLASDQDLEVASLKLEQIEINAAYSAGQITVEQYRDRTKAIESLIDDLTDKHLSADDKVRKSAFDLGVSLQQMASKDFSQIEGVLTRDVENWKGWAKLVNDVFTKLSQDLFQSMLKILLDPLQQQFMGMARQFGNTLTKALGLGGSAQGGVVQSLGMDPLIAALGLNTASTAVNSAGTVANTAGALANTSTQVASVVANTASTIADTATTGVSDAANTAAIIANTVALDTESATGGGGAGGLIADFGTLFGFQEGGNVPQDMIAKLHYEEMVLPPNISNGMRQLFSSAQPSFAGASSAASAAAGGNGFTLINPVFHGVTETTVNTVMNLMVQAARRAGVKFSPVG